MAALKKVKSHPHILEYFKEYPFYGKYIEKSKIQSLKNIDLLSELTFYEELSVLKSDKAFIGYAMSYRVVTIEKKDPIKQSEATKSSIKDLFGDLLDEAKGLRYQITLKVVLKKYKPNEEIEFKSIYFSSTTKTVINQRFSLNKSFNIFYTALITWLMKGLLGFLNQSSLSTLMFQLLGH